MNEYLITDSLDGRLVYERLDKEFCTTVRYNHDLRRMLSNIRTMISELSKKEVEARRLRSPLIVEKNLTEINKAITHFRQLLLMAQLMN